MLDYEEARQGSPALLLHARWPASYLRGRQIIQNFITAHISYLTIAGAPSGTPAFFLQSRVERVVRSARDGRVGAVRRCVEITSGSYSGGPAEDTF